VLWTYCHPWEFDAGEPFYQFEHIGWLASRIGWLNRKRMAKRVGRVLDGPTAPPLGEAVDGLDRSRLPVVAASTAAARRPGRLAGLVNGLLRGGRPTSTAA